MHAAIEIAEKHQTPFGAALAMGDQLFATAANQTQKLHDSTAHAEVMVIRKLGEQLQKTDLFGFTLYTTCEPCPMCMSAAIWAKIDTVFYGCDIPTISNYMKQMDVRATSFISHSFTKMHIAGIEGETKKKCMDLLERFG